MLSTIAWVPRGAVRRAPLRQELSAAELQHLKGKAAEEMMGSKMTAFDGDDSDDDDEGPKRSAKDIMADPAFDSLRGVVLPKGLDLGDADDSDEEGVVGGGAGRDALLEEADEDDADSDDEDYVARSTDVFLCAGNTQEDYSSLEVYCYNTEEGSLYVHHDITLPAFPLSFAWMDYAGEAAASAMVAQCGLRGTKPADFVGSYVAVGTFKPDIEIWNLDVIDPLEPSLVLKGTKPVVAAAAAGGKKGKTAPVKSSLLKGHTDAVLGLAWNRTHRHMLASASADKSVKIWDLDSGRVLHTFSHHLGKAQSVAWNPSEPTILASASFDRTVGMWDARDGADAKIFRYALPADSEALIWNPHNPACMLASCEDGTVLEYDCRAPDTPVWSFKAHSQSATSLSMSYLASGLLATASLDRSVKLWDVDNLNSAGTPSLVSSKEMSIGQIYSVAFFPQSPFMLAAGGSKGLLAIWDVAADAGEVPPSAPAIAPIPETTVIPDDVSLTARRFVTRMADPASVKAVAVRPRADGQPLTEEGAA